MENTKESELMSWDPDEAKKIGSLKGMAEYKIDSDIKHESPEIEFSEPKQKKKIITAAKVFIPKKRNKNSLF